MTRVLFLLTKRSILIISSLAKEIERIPYLPDTNVSHPNEEYVKNMDQFYNSKNALTEPR